ncbi:hypothetical protein K439DRAFT_1649746 [Ramaria rubella]|nr:hypothetical protein K439DRAFT_1649746 [Ramaria rubella]
MLGNAICSICTHFPRMGARNMKSQLQIKYKWNVPQYTILEWFHIHEPDLLREHKVKWFKRKVFFAAGLNHLWPMDQHDKWKYGKILWLKIWWKNSNPHLICGWYLETMQNLGAIPLPTQSDPGSENFGVANAHTALCHHLDPTLVRTCQHKFNLIWHWVTIPWLQAELDVLPHGIPDLIFNEPHNFSHSMDFQLPIDEATIKEVEAQWAPPDHKVFELVPSNFSIQAYTFWERLGSLVVKIHSFWDIFTQMVDAFHGIAPNPRLELQITDTPESRSDGGEADVILLLLDLRPADIHAGVCIELQSTVITLDVAEDGAPAQHEGSASSVQSPQHIWSNEEDGIFVTFMDDEEDDELIIDPADPIDKDVFAD